MTAAGANYHVVRGDTLYAIAIGHGLNYLDLAAWNNIRPPYVIQPGQRLRLKAPATVPQRRVVPPMAPTAPVARIPAGRGISPPLNARPRQSEKAQVAQQRRSQRAAGRNAATPAWEWPISDMRPLSDRNSGPATERGIDIGGRSGQEVRAAAAGEVVHSGPLKHYGKLIILRHRGEYLSVYGYNSELLVKEGEQVDARQLIARMGLSPAGDPVLHFEIIRPDGEPADPRKYLPAQQSPRAGSRG